MAAKRRSAKSSRKSASKTAGARRGAKAGAKKAAKARKAPKAAKSGKAGKASSRGAKASKRPVPRGKSVGAGGQDRARCSATDPFGGPCQNTPRLGSRYCGVHSHLEAMA